MPTSNKGSFNRQDLLQMLLNVGKIAAGAAVEAALQALMHQNFGPYTGLVTLGVAGVLDFWHKLESGPTPPSSP